MTDEEIQNLPRLEPNYGGTFLLLNHERFILARGVPDFQLGDYMKKNASEQQQVRVYKEVYVDCAHCRRARDMVAKAYPNLVRKTIIERLRERKDRETYWCNTCQATGWVLEPTADVVARHDIMTWERKVALLTDAELKEAILTSSDLNFRLYGRGYPPNVLAAEAAKRL
ncbi:hypothetical protein CcrC1_gp347 [Caulobacter phage C1]|nr:hypothetical protein CcrC1_gp347 [Caulobacter phage C1]UTU08576.1 hypothetical protein CcrC2_gp348 [Caulobacter phage C2]UTU09092.1 hypothetical protein CcrJ4_gp343 [Caulobacter phage J4]UTU09650.1 hypothetical protein CcrBL47_gp365 [Caulobacter phage BL47]UTU10209.1 hypothetical protein CcrRB23_gp347 [Caulobacter phage RB23]WGN97243.1 hypothetical protein [Bertelyvirus sp.]